MELIIGDLRLFDVPEGFAAHYDKIQEAKLNVLFYLSYRYPDAAPVFYNVYSKWALLDETESVLSSYFGKYSVMYGDSPVNSSPLNNRPKVLLDQQVVDLDLPELKLISAEGLDVSEYSDPNVILASDLLIRDESRPSSKDGSFLRSEHALSFEDHLLFSQIAATAKTNDNLLKTILIKLLRDEPLC